MKSLREMMDLVEGSSRVGDIHQLEAEVEHWHKMAKNWFHKGNESARLKSLENLKVAQEKLRQAKSVADVSLEEQEVAEEVTPESVEKINKLYQDKQ